MAALLILLLSATGGISMDRPLQLVAEPTESGVNVMVVGSSDVECLAEYELIVQGGKSANNRSIQRGKAHLLPSKKIIVAKTSLGVTAPAVWTARLLVKGCEGTSYEMNSGSGNP